MDWYWYFLVFVIVGAIASVFDFGSDFGEASEIFGKINFSLLITIIIFLLVEFKFS